MNILLPRSIYKIVVINIVLYRSIYRIKLINIIKILTSAEGTVEMSNAEG